MFFIAELVQYGILSAGTVSYGPSTTPRTDIASPDWTKTANVVKRFTELRAAAAPWTALPPVSSFGVVTSQEIPSLPRPTYVNGAKRKAGQNSEALDLR